MNIINYLAGIAQRLRRKRGGNEDDACILHIHKILFSLFFFCLFFLYKTRGKKRITTIQREELKKNCSSLGGKGRVVKEGLRNNG